MGAITPNILKKLTGLSTTTVWPGILGIPSRGYILGTREKSAYLTTARDALDIVFLLRDPRDVETSMRFYRFPDHFKTEADAIISHLGWFRWYLYVGTHYPTIWYERLWNDPVEALAALFVAMRRPVPEEARLREVIEQERFEIYSQGRARGQEDTTSHHRKGIIGDWMYHWDKEKTVAFQERFGKEMRQLGYN